MSTEKEKKLLAYAPIGLGYARIIMKDQGTRSSSTSFSKNQGGQGADPKNI